MSDSIFWPVRIFNRLKHKQRAVDSVLQIGRSGLGASQIGNNASLSNNLAFGSGYGSGRNQANINQSYNVSEGRSEFKGNDWASRFVGQINAGASESYCGLGAGYVAHDGSYKMFRWDNAKGCMVPWHPSMPLRSRLGKSFRAFVNAWRSA